MVRVLNDLHIGAVILGSLAGTGARIYMLRIDYRQYPSYPQGLTIHLALGVIASFLGAVAAPAVAAGEFAAATFLALAATQFREVRSMERDTLLSLEESELVPRGAAYIEGIARVFEARNYLAMFAALVASTVAVVVGHLGASLAVSLIIGALGALGMLFFLKPGVEGPHVGDLADIEIVPIEFDGPLLTVAGVVLMNIGIKEARERYLNDGVGVLMIPKNPDAKATMANIGQRQAIAHDTATLVGVTKEVDEPYYTPLVRRDGKNGHVVMAIIPAENNPEAIVKAVKRVPVLEAAVRRPTTSVAGQMVD